MSNTICKLYSYFTIKEGLVECTMQDARKREHSEYVEKIKSFAV